MNINQTTGVNFGDASGRKILKKVTTFRVPGKNGTTVVTDLIEIGRNERLTNLEYRIMQKGKILEAEAFQNKRGFKDERLCQICETIQNKVRDGFDFLDELLKAQIRSYK